MGRHQITVVPGRRLGPGQPLRLIALDSAAAENATGSITPAARVEQPVDTAGQIRRDQIHRPLRAVDLLYSGRRGYMELDRRGAERL
jgi:hypothetical protein